MTNVKISQLPLAIALGGDEFIEVDQGGTSRKAQTGLLLSRNGGPQAANTVLAGPVSGPDAVPTFRNLVADDLPLPTFTTVGAVMAYEAAAHQFLTAIHEDGTISSAQPTFPDISGTLGVNQGGTGAQTFTQHGVLIGEGTSPVVSTAAMSDGQILVGQTSADPLPKSVTGDVTLTAAGAITVNNNAITNAKLAQAPGGTIKGNASGVTANVADLTVLPTAAVPPFTGDVANSAGSLTMTIQPNVVSNAKLAQAPANTIKGNATGSTANVTDLTTIPTGTFPALTGDVTTPAGSVVTTIGANKVTRGMLAQGSGLSVIGVTGSATANEADIVGTANQVLRVNGAGTSLAFGAVDISQSAAVTGTLNVANGGTGRATLTAHGVLIGEGTGGINASVAMTAGQILVGQGATSDPTPQTVSSDATLASTGALTIANNAVTNAKFRQSVARSVVGNATNATANVADIQGTANQVLVVNSGGTALGFGQVNLASTAAITGSLGVANGGTGQATLTAHGVLIGEGTSGIAATAAMTAGQILVGQGATSDPTPQTVSSDATLASSGALTISNGAVTNAKMANMASNTVKSNVTGLSAAPSDNSISAILDTIGSAQGDVLYRDSTGNGGWKVLAPGTAGNVLTTNGSSANPTWTAAGSGAPVNATYVTLSTDPTLTNERVLTAGSGIKLTDGGANSTITVATGGVPTVQRFPSGSSLTYTPSAGITYVRVRMAAGGGGGGAATTNNGSNGNDTSFELWTAKAGSGGKTLTSSPLGGAGGTGGTNGTGTLINRQAGGSGCGASFSFSNSAQYAGAPGGTNPFGGAGQKSGNNTAGEAGTANTGAGGQGGGSPNTSAFSSGSGGGAGEYVEFIMTAAQIGAGVTYTVGTGGNGGTAGVNAGGAGAAGIIIVEEFYN